MTALLAGCRTGPDTPHVSDWQSEDFAPPPPAVVPAPAPLPPAVPPAVSAPTNGVLGWVGLNRWCRERGLAAPARIATVPLAAFALSLGNGLLVLHPGSQMAQWNGVEVRLGFAAQSADDEPRVHALDLKKTIEPLLAGGIDGLATNRVIVIDPGHGGDDSGAKSVRGGRYEKDYTLDWGCRLARLLAQNGWQVYLTRTNDCNLSLSNRVAAAEEHKAALFLSLHFNSAGAETHQSGLETYCLAPAGMPSAITRGLGDDPSLVFPNNSFDAANFRAACLVHRALIRANGLHDRGVRRARFLSVLRGQNRPAILIEGGYLSNPHEAALIADARYRQKLAEAVGQALGRCTAAE